MDGGAFINKTVCIPGEPPPIPSSISMFSSPRLLSVHFVVFALFVACKCESEVKVEKEDKSGRKLQITALDFQAVPVSLGWWKKGRINVGYSVSSLI